MQILFYIILSANNIYQLAALPDNLQQRYAALPPLMPVRRRGPAPVPAPAPLLAPAPAPAPVSVSAILFLKNSLFAN